MADEGWQPDPTGRHEYRYFDGSSWTEHVGDAGVTSADPFDADITQPVERPDPTTESESIPSEQWASSTAAAPPEQGDATEPASADAASTEWDLAEHQPDVASKGRDWLRETWTFKRWVILAAVVGALILGGIVGSLTQTSTADDLEAENEALADDIDALSEERDQLQDQVDDRQAQRESDEAAAERAQAEREQARQERQEEERRQAEEEAAAAQRAAEEAAAAEAARNTIPGDGIFAIGPEKSAGRYQTGGSIGFGCYYAVLSAPSGPGIDHIISNNNVDGPAIVDLQDGQFFETSGCQDWTKIG